MNCKDDHELELECSQIMSCLDAVETDVQQIVHYKGGHKYTYNLEQEKSKALQYNTIKE